MGDTRSVKGFFADKFLGKNTLEKREGYGDRDINQI
jgi:hypothetical protein